MNTQYTTTARLLLNLHQTTRTLFEITPEEETQLLSIANSRTATAYKAQALLFVARGYEFAVNLPELDFVNWSNWQTAFKNAAANGNLNRVVSALYPNPATQTAQLNYRLPDQTTAALTIYDLTGRIMHTAVLKNNGIHTVPVHNYTAGIYYYTISINGVPHNQNKLVIVN